MSFADDIAEKRKQQRADTQSSALHAESVDAVNGSGADIISALFSAMDGPKQVSVTNNQDLAKKDDIDKILGQLKEIHLTNLLEANKPKEKIEPLSPHAMLTDSALYVGDSIKELSDKVLTKLDDKTTDTDMQNSLLELKDLLTSMQKDSKVSNPAFSKLQNSIDNLEVNPVVNVAAPKVTVQPTPVDFKPLQDSLKEYMDSDSDTLDLSCYRAQDLLNSGDTQYVGFVNPQGNWYIIENLTKQNSLRYVFGNTDYTKAWEDAPSHVYSLLNEAINALST